MQVQAGKDSRGGHGRGNAHHDLANLPLTLARLAEALELGAVGLQGRPELVEAIRDGRENLSDLVARVTRAFDCSHVVSRTLGCLSTHATTIAAASASDEMPMGKR